MMLIIDVEAAASFDELTRSNADDQLAQQGDQNWPNSFRAARFTPAVEYIQANRIRQALIESVATVFEQIDVLVAPPWQGRSIQWANLTGHPCVVVPNGTKTGSNPASITFIGKLYGEGAILEVANAYQQATTHHRQRPPLEPAK
jgi:Asp-tRNA(Asn)/Glu-tRNA(Gln) amidotransferase A subunit family amidase